MWAILRMISKLFSAKSKCGKKSSVISISKRKQLQKNWELRVSKSIMWRPLLPNYPNWNQKLGSPTMKFASLSTPRLIMTGSPIFSYLPDSSLCGLTSTSRVNQERSKISKRTRKKSGWPPAFTLLRSLMHTRKWLRIKKKFWHKSGGNILDLANSD